MQHGGDADLKCHFRMATAHFELLQFDEAARSIQAARNLDPSDGSVKVGAHDLVYVIN